ncbi:hypothetical protein [Alkalihalobacterium chitinilyticum]|uniref:Uncharacterized protein n=1 Tax=Alkalihalobacterium chitinilyticum TaxID=2980103 RepID=A0ABT5VAR9_9BACI|nr:hypothetical protein [Alkalihalobacterium chitinilyticum]MDE5412571.1 hypothetical protein [Alkalihalobacterium chitinilyticum]
MKTKLPPTFTEYWRGKAEVIDIHSTKTEQKEVQPEDLGREWRELLEAVQTAAKREWE